MDIGIVIGIITILVIIFGLGGGIGYWFWLKTKERKETWTAKVYQLSSGIGENYKDKFGKNIVNLKMQDLKPYFKDVLEKITTSTQLVVYRLIRLEKTVEEVPHDCVDVWDKADKEVNILYNSGTCTVLRKGYDKQTGEMIFHPMPISRINMIKSEMSSRKDRLKDTKDLLPIISPIIVGAIALITLVIMAFVIGQSFVEVAEINSDTIKEIKGIDPTLANLQQQQQQAAAIGEVTDLHPSLE